MINTLAVSDNQPDRSLHPEHENAGPGRHNSRKQGLPSREQDLARIYPREQDVLRADRAAISLCAAMNRVVLPLSRAAATFVTAGGWSVFGFARLDDYCRERLGRSGRWLRDLAALGRLLVQHPILATAVTGEDGGRPIGRVAALLIGRVVPPARFDQWIANARRMSIRRLRKSIREADFHANPGFPHDATTTSTQNRPGTDTPTFDAAWSSEEEGIDAEDSARVLARLHLPRAVRVAFDEALDLFRCVDGRESSVTSFIEALVAENVGLEGCGDIDENPLNRGQGRALAEDLLARSTNHWSHLPAIPSARDEASRALGDLLSFQSLDRSAGDGDATVLDRQLHHLIRHEDSLSVRLGRLLMEMGERGAWARLRFTGPGHYAEERLRIGRSRAEDRVRVARALRRFSVLRHAYERGLIGLEATLRIVRLLGAGVADRATEDEWVRHAVITTVKRLRDESRALGRGVYLNRSPTGFHPSMQDRASPQSTEAEFRPPHQPLVPLGPGNPLSPLTDAEWHRSLRRAIGTARERVHQLGLIAAGVNQMTMPPTAPGASSALPASPDVFLSLRLPAELSSSFLATVEAARRRLTGEVGDDPWTETAAATGERPSWVAARTFSNRARRIPSWVGLLALLEEFVDIWDRQQRSTRPARDAIYIRDGWRCAAPGCTSRRNLEDHHVIYRSRGGNDSYANRICLCRFHHQMGEHGSLAACSGTAPLAIMWHLGRAGIGGRFRNEKRTEVAA